jgi:hypothetical protein
MIHAEKVKNSCVKVRHFPSHVRDQTCQWLDHHLTPSIEIP